MSNITDRIKLKIKNEYPHFKLVDYSIPISNGELNISLSSILQSNPGDKYFVDESVVSKICNNEKFTEYLSKRKGVVSDIYDDYNSKFREDGISGTLTCNIGNSAHRNGQKVVYCWPNNCAPNKMPIDSFQLTETRTEEAKEIRRQFQKEGKDYSPRRGKVLVPRTDNGANCITATVGKEHYVAHVYDEYEIAIRRLMPNECERLQSYPIDYTRWGRYTTLGDFADEIKELPDGIRYKMIGNGITANVSATIINSIFPTGDYRLMSLFTGCGGTEARMDPRFEVVAYSEIEKNCAAVFKYHHPNLKNYGDITEMDFNNLPKFDIVIGGFPCQSFSLAGLRKGFEDKRGQLIFHVFRLIDVCKPKYLIMENVKGLLTHDEGHTFISILDGLTELGYEFDFQLVNSRNFGVAQNRERVFIIGKLVE